MKTVRNSILVILALAALLAAPTASALALAAAGAGGAAPPADSVDAVSVDRLPLVGGEGLRFLGSAEDDGHVWVADDYAYRVREFSPGGRLLTEIAVAEIAFGIVERPEAEYLEIAEAITRQGGRLPMGLGEGPKAAILGLAVRDGWVYLFVEDDGQVVLDRWDPVNLFLERARLAGDVPAEKLSVAAGAEGLFVLTLAGPAEEGWRIGWSSLETASWTPVEGATVNGLPIVDRRPVVVRVVRTADGVRVRAARGTEQWSFDVRGEVPGGFVDPMVERGLLDAEQAAVLAWFGSGRVTAEMPEATAADVVRDLNAQLVESEARLVAVDGRQRVDLVADDAAMADVVAALQAVGVVRVESP